MKVKLEDVEKTTISTNHGELDYIAVPMRPCSALTTFQLSMELIFTAVWMNL